MASESQPLPELVRDSRLETESFKNRRTIHFYHDTPTTTRREVWQREEKPIGRGHFAEVWLERCVEAGSVRAVKVIRLNPDSDENFKVDVSDFARELETLAKFSRRKYWRCFVQSYGWFQCDEDQLCVALEYMHFGDLRSYLSTRGGRIAETDVQQIAGQLLDGLKCMHEENFTHRDLKPANVLIKGCPPDESWWVVLSDFGLSKRIASFQTGSSGLPGTMGYMAPEIFFGRKGDPINYKAADIWSLGEILFRMLTGQPTFPDIRVWCRYYDRQCDFPVGELKKSSPDVTALIMDLMAADPACRSDAGTALSHPWMSKQPISDPTPQPSLTDIPDALRKATEEYVRQIKRGPHTSFKALEILLTRLNLSAGEYLRNPMSLLGFRAERVHDIVSEPWRGTWDSGVGRDAEFCIAVTHALATQYPGIYSWCYYDLGRHRLARCTRTGTVIDSQMLPTIIDNTKMLEGDHRFPIDSYAFVHLQGRAERSQDDLLPISPEFALGRSLEEVVRNAVAVCAFRSIPDTVSIMQRDEVPEALYFGSLRWRLAKRRIELAPDIGRRDEVSTITFGDGTPETNRECAISLVTFIRRCGLESQWKQGGIDKFNQKLWLAAVMEWGYPIWKPWSTQTEGSSS
ncbi:Protein kinase-like domain containing protein [Rhypophila decipiens]